MNVLFNMISYYSATTESQIIYHEAVGNILLNIHEVGNLTCNELAERCFVAPSTIIRLCKKLGYSSFSAFKTEVRNAVSGFSYFNEYFPPSITLNGYLDYVERMTAQIRGVVNEEKLKAIAECIRQHHDVYFFSGEYPVIIQYFELCLFLSGHHVEFFTRLKDFEGIRKRVNDNSFLCVIRTDNSVAVDTDKIILDAKSRGAKVLLVTNTPRMFIEPQVDFHLNFDGERVAILDTFGIDYLLGCLLIKYKELYLDSSPAFLQVGPEE